MGGATIRAGSVSETARDQRNRFVREPAWRFRFRAHFVTALHRRIVDATIWAAGLFGGCAVLAGLLQAAEIFVFPDRMYAILCLGVAISYLVQMAVNARYGRVSPLVRRGTIEFRKNPVLFLLMFSTLAGLLLALIIALGRFLLSGAS